jgi:hypothetical protein
VLGLALAEDVNVSGGQVLADSGDNGQVIIECDVKSIALLDVT